MTLFILFDESQKKLFKYLINNILTAIIKNEKITGVINMLETNEVKIGTNIETNNIPEENPKSSVKQIYDDRIRNFLNAVCEIVVFDLNDDKNFKAIESVLNQLKKDEVFSKAIEDNADILYQEIVEDINKKDKGTIYCNYKRAIVGNLSTVEFCLFVSFFLPKTQRDQFQNQLQKQCQQGDFNFQLPPFLKKYLSDSLKNYIESNNVQNHYEMERIRDDGAEFNGDSELQRLYIKLLKAIRDDIALGDNAIYKERKQDLLKLNNALIEKMGDIQETYKQMPGWLRSEFKIGFLDHLTIRGKCVIQKNNNQMLFCQLNDNNSGNKIRFNISQILNFSRDHGLYLQSQVEISNTKIGWMNVLSFFYYGLNLKFFADLFRLDMHKEDFTILFALPIVITEILGLVCFPFTVPLAMLHILSGMFGFLFLICNLFIYRGKFIASEDINSYNEKLNTFGRFVNEKFKSDDISLSINSVSQSEKYDTIIDKYEDKYRNNIRISSGCCEDCVCDCNCDCDCRDCPSAGECLCGCLNAAANDPHCCECVGLCCLLLLCPCCAPFIAGNR